MENPEIKDPGAIEAVAARLVLWSRRAPKGLARAEFSSEPARRRVVERLKKALREDDIPLHEIQLPRTLSPAELIRYLLDQLAALDTTPGVVSITGFEGALPYGVAQRDALRIFNFNRENLARPGLRLIWWMTPPFAETFIHTAPDLNSWFLVRLHLTEEPPVPTPKDGVQLDVSSTTARNLEDARKRAQELAKRFERALETEPDVDALVLDLALPAVEALDEAGALQEARNLERRLALLLDDQQQYDETAPLHYRAVAFQEKKHGPDHPHTASSLNNLAALLDNQGHYDEAEPFYRRALNIVERVLGPDHPDTILYRENLRTFLRERGRDDEAAALGEDG